MKERLDKKSYYLSNAEVPAEFAPSSAKGTLNNKEFLARFVRIAEETA